MRAPRSGFSPSARPASSTRKYQDAGSIPSSAESRSARSRNASGDVPRVAMPELSAVAPDRMRRSPQKGERSTGRPRAPAMRRPSVIVKHRLLAGRHPCAWGQEDAPTGAPPARTGRHAFRRPDAGRRARAVRAPRPHLGPACSDADPRLLRAYTGRPRRDARRDRRSWPPAASSTSTAGLAAAEGVVVGTWLSGTAMSLARRSTRSPRRVGSAAPRPRTTHARARLGARSVTHMVGVWLMPDPTPLRSSLERVSEPRVECSDTPREHARRFRVLRATCVEGTLGERAAGVHTSARRRIGIRSRGFRLRFAGRCRSRSLRGQSVIPRRSGHKEMMMRLADLMLLLRVRNSLGTQPLDVPAAEERLHD